MGAMRKKVYEALIEGVARCRSDDELYAFVRTRCPETSSRTLVRASLLALTDPDLSDGKALCTIYALALKHRLDGVRSDEIDDVGDDDPLDLTPSICSDP
ncbi:hypothetical protein [Ensifer aridi]|uniref:hypothetical protein n=1 Tax=Ensifer aridi TaxID=1708715 RepID=UPI000A10CF6A|nr:hypothetical protein [Ensifer aridi]